MDHYAYVGIAPCGCVLMAVVDDPDPEIRKDTAKEVAAAINRGMVIERITSEDVRERFGHRSDCPVCRPVKLPGLDK